MDKTAIKNTGKIDVAPLPQNTKEDRMSWDNLKEDEKIHAGVQGTTPEGEQDTTAFELENKILTEDEVEAELQKCIETYMNSGLDDYTRKRAENKANIIIGRRVGRDQVHGSREAFPSGHDRKLGESGAPSRAGTYTTFEKSGWNSPKKNRYALTHKEGE